ncbi:lipase [Reticulomyxa filosa]|uniref:Lipase n=1 Tax=Reticulomyxa filosa TaxID=46433 RepID=X6M8Z5_RETFI|nr:lipase [Reticulomyxa filosa]|eukprot:ETO09932.1 lipase [Reticulomyxa filosa]
MLNNMKVSSEYKLKICVVLFRSKSVAFNKRNSLVQLFLNFYEFQTSKVKITQQTVKELRYGHKLAWSTYCDKSAVEDWNCPYCTSAKNFELYEYIEGGKAESLVAIVGYDKTYHQVVVSFRGSANLPNWVVKYKIFLFTDLQAWQVSYPAVSDGLVHAGFYEAWKDLEDSVTSAYKTVLADYPQSPVLVTGHSLGAALAALAVLDLKNVGTDDSSTYPSAFYVHTFGQPRWANAAVASYFESSVSYHWRVVNMHDIVPQVPTTFMNYKHTTKDIWYWCDRPLSYYLCDSSDGEDKKCQYLAGTVGDHLVSVLSNIYLIFFFFLGISICSLFSFCVIWQQFYMNTKFVCGQFSMPDNKYLPPSCFPNPTN